MAACSSRASSTAFRGTDSELGMGGDGDDDYYRDVLQLQFPVEESLDAIAFSVAWHMRGATLAHFSDADVRWAKSTAPDLFAPRPANLEELLRFCTSVIHGMYDIVRKAVVQRLALDTVSCDRDTYASRLALRIVVESSIDVATLLSSKRDPVLTTERILSARCQDGSNANSGSFSGGGSSSTSKWSPPTTPSKALHSSGAGGPSPLSNRQMTSPVGHGKGEATTTTAAAAGGGGEGSFRTRKGELPSMFSPKAPASSAAAAAEATTREAPRATAATQGIYSGCTMERLVNAHTCINLMVCAMLDSLVSLALTDVSGTQRQPSEDVASDAFFSVAFLVGTDPEELLTKFLAFQRVTPYSLRRVWTLSLDNSSSPSPSSWPPPLTAPPPPLLHRNEIDGSGGGGSVETKDLAGSRQQLLRCPRLLQYCCSSDSSDIDPMRLSEYRAAVTASTWATTSRTLIVQRSVMARLLEAAGPAAPVDNTEIAHLWRYVL